MSDTPHWMKAAPERRRAVSDLDTGAAHSARVWNYLLRGKDNFAADREVGDQILHAFPDIARIARLQRYFLARAVHFLAGQAGIRQFLDIGTGLPTVDNTHEVAQQVAPEARIVYVDNDPLVLTHARALLTSTPEGATDYIEADVRNPDMIFEEAAKTLDFTQPTALTLLGIMGQLPDEDQPYAIANQLLGALPSGSYLAFSDGTNTNETLNEAIRIYNATSASSYHLRSPEQLAGFFEDLELVEPGIGPLAQWRPDPNSDTTDEASLDVFGGVARKP